MRVKDFYFRKQKACREFDKPLFLSQNCIGNRPTTFKVLSYTTTNMQKCLPY